MIARAAAEAPARERHHTVPVHSLKALDLDRQRSGRQPAIATLVHTHWHAARLMALSPQFAAPGKLLFI
jgi:hypothetical protein